MLGYKLVLDLSYHQLVDYDVVSPHIDGVILRGAFGKWRDPAFLKHYENFRARGKPVAAYQWFRPDEDVKVQIETMKLVLDGTDVNLVLSDQEQHGLYAAGLIIPPYYSGDRLSTLGLAHITGLETHGFKMGIYSRATWIEQWARPIKSWFYNYITDLASWPFATGAVTTTWEILKSTWAPKVFSPYITAGWPVRQPRSDIWQWSGDKFILPGIKNTNGIPRSVDLNYVSDQTFALFTKVVPPPVEPPPVVIPPLTIEERVAKVEARVESAYGEIDQLQQIARTKGWEV